MRFSICFFLFILLVSCDKTPENSIIVTGFPLSEKLKGDTVDYFDSELGILNINDAGKYWLCSSHRTDYHFAVYSKSNIEKVAELCVNGRGAGEFIAPAYFSQYVTEGGDLKIWILFGKN